MTSAPLSQQRQLLELQDLDNQLSRLAARRRTLPVLGEIENAVKELKENKRLQVLAQAEAGAAKQVLKRADDDVEQTNNRAKVLRKRLHSGTVSARDLGALQGELDQLGKRLSVLETKQLQALETYEDLSGKYSELQVREGEIRAFGRELTAKRDSEFARIDSETSQVTQRREQLAASLSQSLVQIYERARKATGGLGVVGLYGSRSEPAIEISPQELSAIRAAERDAVIISEETEAIIVRMDD